MSRRARHRFTQKESDAMYNALTSEEREEYNGLVIGSFFGSFTTNNERIRALETAGYSRLKGNK